MTKKSVIEYRQKVCARLAGEGRILDLGFNQYPNKYFKGKVVGVDNTIGDCPENYQKVIKADLNFWCDLGRYDSVCALEILEHMTNPVGFLQSCWDWLRPNGKLILSTPNPFYWSEILTNVITWLPSGRPEDHIMFFSEREMEKLFNLAGFELVSVRSVAFHIPLTRIETTIDTPLMILSNRIIYEVKKK